MRKKKVVGILLGICLAISALSGCGSESKETSLSGENDEADFAEDSVEESGLSETVETEIESGGLLTEEVAYNADGGVDYVYRYIYEDGKLVRRDYYHYEYPGEYDRPYMWTDYDYDAAGNEIGYVIYQGDSSSKFAVSAVGYEIDGQGNRVKEMSYATGDSDNMFYGDDKFETGPIDAIYSYEYDEAGNMITRASVLLDADTGETSFTSWEWYEYEFDSAGNVTKMMTYITYDTPENKRPYMTYEYEYDAAGNQVKMAEITHSSGGFDTQNDFVYEYDAAGNKLKETKYGWEGELIWQIEYEYGK